jgi:hypothetical protein
MKRVLSGGRIDTLIIRVYSVKRRGLEFCECASQLKAHRLLAFFRGKSVKGCVESFRRHRFFSASRLS